MHITDRIQGVQDYQPLDLGSFHGVGLYEEVDEAGDGSLTTCETTVNLVNSSTDEWSWSRESESLCVGGQCFALSTGGHIVFTRPAQFS